MFSTIWSAIFFSLGHFCCTPVLQYNSVFSTYFTLNQIFLTFFLFGYNCILSWAAPLSPYMHSYCCTMTSSPAHSWLSCPICWNISFNSLWIHMNQTHVCSPFLKHNWLQTTSCLPSTLVFPPSRGQSQRYKVSWRCFGHWQRHHLKKKRKRREKCW